MANMQAGGCVTPKDSVGNVTSHCLCLRSASGGRPPLSGDFPNNHDLCHVHSHRDSLQRQRASATVAVPRLWLNRRVFEALFTEYR